MRGKPILHGAQHILGDNFSLGARIPRDSFSLKH